MKTAIIFREVRNAARETPRLYFSAVLDIVRFIERIGGVSATQQRSSETVAHSPSHRRVMNARRPSGRSLATSLGNKRKHSNHTNA